MSRFARLALPLLAVALTALPALAREPMKAGRWQVSVSVTAAGMAMPPTAQTECLSEADVNSESIGDLSQGACRATHGRRSDEGVTWDLECAEGKGHGEVHYSSPTQYGGTMTLDVGGTAVKAVIDAHRVGDC